MLDHVLQLFDIQPDFDLDLVRPGQDLSDITSRVLLGPNPLLTQWYPDAVLVHGDTATTFAASLAAFYQRIPSGMWKRVCAPATFILPGLRKPT